VSRTKSTTGPTLAYSLVRVRRTTKLEKLIEEALQLPASDRRRLIEAVERSVEGETEARPFAPGSYGRLVALAGTAMSDFSDVSTDKYRHVAEAYAPKPGDE
jgi:hypothetical protein